MILNLALVISTFDKEVRGESHGLKCIVDLGNDLDARGVVLNLASLISASIWKSEGK